MTRVAVLMPYYNHPTGLQRSLDSLRGETEAFTLYLVDDGNVPALQINPAEYHFPIRILRMEKNAGIVKALNCGLTQILADGFDLIARFDAGDDWIAGRLAAQRDFMLSHPDHVLLGSWATAVDGTGRELFTLKYAETDAGIRRFMRLNNCCPHTGAMLRASTIHAIGIYSEHYPAAEDYELFWRLLDYGKAANLPYPWVRYEVDPTAPSISFKKRRVQLLSRLKLQLEKFNPLEPLAWWGALRTAIVLIVPYAWLNAIKRILHYSPKASV